MDKPHGGTLENWFHYIGHSIAGEIHDDPRGLFPSGHMIQTSSIVFMDTKGGVLETKNTIYKLGNRFNPNNKELKK